MIVFTFLLIQGCHSDSTESNSVAIAPTPSLGNGLLLGQIDKVNQEQNLSDESLLLREDDASSCEPPECAGWEATYTWTFNSSQFSQCAGSDECTIGIVFDVLACTIDNGFEYHFHNFFLDLDLALCPEPFNSSVDIACMLEVAKEAAVMQFMQNLGNQSDCDDTFDHVHANLYAAKCVALCGKKSLKGDQLWREINCGQTCCVKRTRWCDGAPHFVGITTAGDCTEVDPGDYVCQQFIPCSTGCFPID